MNKPIIVKSACLENCKCRYDGSVIPSKIVRDLEPFVEFINICPEMSIGLSSPREALRIIDKQDGLGERFVFSRSGGDMTQEMKSFTKGYLEGLDKSQIDGFLLKAGSPSCGFKDVKKYRDFGKASKYNEKTKGFFGRSVVDMFGNLPIEDEGRLSNFSIREMYYTRIFMNAEFRSIAKTHYMKDLVKFHSEYKYLIMAYNQAALKTLGQIVSNGEKLKSKEVYERYSSEFSRVFERIGSPGRNVNMLLHLFGYFKKDLNVDEKAYFLEQIEMYTANRIPLSVPLSIIYTWVVRYDEPYLKTQRIFNPFPRELMMVTDSGKGRL